MTVRVVNGANEGSYNIAGQSIAYVRKIFRDILNISPDARAWVNGKLCSNGTLLKSSDNLEFGHTFGQKGGLSNFLSESEMRQLFGGDVFEQMCNNGLKPTVQPVFCLQEVLAWSRGESEQSAEPAKQIPVSIDIDKELLTYEGCIYHCNRTLALVLKCLIDAKGEIRSTTQIKETFPDEPWEDRLDITIKRKLMKHESGIGQFIESVSKKGYRFCIDACE